eukprot:scpid74804/ scgid7188/ 
MYKKEERKKIIQKKALQSTLQSTGHGKVVRETGRQGDMYPNIGVALRQVATGRYTAASWAWYDNSVYIQTQGVFTVLLRISPLEVDHGSPGAGCSLPSRPQ